MISQSRCVLIGSQLATALVCWSLLGVDAAIAQADADTKAPSPTVAPDRPGFSNGSGLIPPGRLQLEAGASAGFGDIVDTYTPLNVLGRLGVSDFAELRLGVVPVTVSNLSTPEGSAVDASGTEATYLPSTTLGAKFSTMFGDQVQAGLLPSVSLAEVTDSAVATAGLDGLLTVGGLGPVGLTFNAGVSNLVSVGNEGGVTEQLTVTGAASVGVSLSETVGLFVEPYTLIPTSGGDPLVALDGGVTWRVAPQLQLDAWGDVTLNQGQTISVGLGASYLL